MVERFQIEIDWYHILNTKAPSIKINNIHTYFNT